MLDPTEATEAAEQFRADDLQVRRDHLLSHLLAVIGRLFADRLVFFGGTALARTHLPDGRLSEDLDLIALPVRAALATELERVLVTGVRRDYGTLTWDPPLQSVIGATPGVLRTSDGLSVRIQLLDSAGYPRWPTERRQLVNRHSGRATGLDERADAGELRSVQGGGMVRPAGATRPL